MLGEIVCLGMEKNILSQMGKVTDVVFHSEDPKSISGTVTIDFFTSGDFSEYIEDGKVTKRFINEVLHEFMKRRQLPTPRREM